MDEQPVAFAMNSRSPNICVSSLMYGVSPQPAQAPEYSRSGSANCMDFNSGASFVRSGTESLLKKVKFSCSCLRRGDMGNMSSALCSGLALSLAGQMTAQSVQPVQSSGETWIVYLRPFSFDR